MNDTKQEVKALLQEQVNGALIRASISPINDMDAPYIRFNLERKAVQQKHECYPCRDGGTMTYDPGEMRVMDLYANLYGTPDWHHACLIQLLKGLPRAGAG